MLLATKMKYAVKFGWQYVDRIGLLYTGCSPPGGSFAANAGLFDWRSAQMMLQIRERSLPRPQKNKIDLTI